MGWTDLHSAAFDGDAEEVKKLLKKAQTQTSETKTAIRRCT
jgi:hypothetical protein